MVTHRWIFISCYGASGAAALIYQVAWVRLFTLTLGHTAAASSTVLAAFMGGLSLGAWAAGRLRSEQSRNLRSYAALELFIAVIAVALPTVFSAFEPSIASTYADGTRPLSFAIARVAVSLILLGIPAAAMGATYPIAVAWLAHLQDAQSRDPRLRAAIDAGALYGVNTAGAATGAIAAGFWLIPSLGIRATTWIGVCLNIAAGCGALWLARAQRASAPAPMTRPRGRRTAPLQHTFMPRPSLALAAAAVSGFAALVYEVTWTRLLALIIGPTTYAFALMAASFISGIALGSSLGVRLVRRNSNVTHWLAAMLSVTAVATLLAAWFTTSRLPLIVAHQVAAATEFGPLLFREALSIVIVLMPASISLGATFTLALATASSGIDAAAKETARLYVVNTLGAVAGALGAGFVFIPAFGLQGTFVYTSGLLLVSGVAIAAAAAIHPVTRRPTRRAAAVTFAGAAIAAFTFLIPEWDRDLLTSGAYKYSRLIPTEDLEWSLRAGHLEYYREGAAGTVSVRRLAGTRSLAIDGKVDASNGGDMLTQRLLGLLPTLVHPEPRDALVIGLGSGVTADAILASGEVQRLDVVEISPEVVEASTYFERENRGVLKRTGVRLLVGDGRSHLRLSDRQYDVIVSEPRDPRFHDIWRINIDTGEKKLVQQNAGVAGYVTDDKYDVRLSLTFTPTGGASWKIAEGVGDAKTWKDFLEFGSVDAMTSGPAGFDKSGQTLYLQDSRDRNTSGLFAMDLKTGGTKLIAEDPRTDVGGALVHPTEKNIQAVSFTYARTEWKILDPAIAPDIEFLKKFQDGDFIVTSRTLDDSQWTVAYTTDNGPVKFYRYVRTPERKMVFLFNSRDDLGDYPLVKMHDRVIKSRDGLDLVCYLTLPPGSDPDGDGVPDKPVPLMLDVHGGPWARDDWGFNGHHQWLANRGYAVLNVNYRGSTGFGKTFTNAANGEWSGKMHEDLLDAVQWAIDQKIADKDKVAIGGGSYGGYATLVGLTYTPDVFACGVDIVGPSSLVTLLENAPDYWQPFMPVMKVRVGDKDTEEGRAELLKRSPLMLVDKIKKPLLIGQGKHDPRVTQLEADQIVKAMTDKKIPVTYVLYPDEGHGFHRPENNKSFNAVTEAFLAQQLGGRFEPIGDDFKGATITVPEGAEHVPGLKEALAAMPKSEPEAKQTDPPTQ